jgi:hypothetical protein
VLGLLSELGLDSRRARRARRVAALLVYSELTTNLAGVSALRKFGVFDEHTFHRSAWEANAPAFCSAPTWTAPATFTRPTQHLKTLPGWHAITGATSPRAMTPTSLTGSSRCSRQRCRRLGLSRVDWKEMERRARMSRELRGASD